MSEEGLLAEWVGSRDCAPGPGRWYEANFGLKRGWHLFGVVERVSPADSESITVRWDNGRRTIERRRNLEITGPIAMAAVG